MQKELLQKPQIAAIGQHIGYEAGEEMVKRFFDKHPDQAYGNIMGREIIEKILSQPDCAGITVVPGYDENGNRHVVLVGIDSVGNFITKYNVVNISGELDTSEGIIADRDKTIVTWSSI